MSFYGWMDAFLLMDDGWMDDFRNKPILGTDLDKIHNYEFSVVTD